MLTGICVDASMSTNLMVGKKYYLFEHGAHAFYVSRFPKEMTHFGAYSKSRFDDIQGATVEADVRNVEPPLIAPLENNKLYIATLDYAGTYNTKKQRYYIKPRKSKTHCNFYQDPEFQRFVGCFPIHWFIEYQEFIPSEAFVEKEVAIMAEPEVITGFEQISIFDFLSD